MAHFHIVIDAKGQRTEVPFTPEEEAAITAREEEARKVEYKYKRQAEYPPITDQLDAIWKELASRKDNGEELSDEANDLLQDILAVKSKYPKPQEE